MPCWIDLGREHLSLCLHDVLATGESTQRICQLDCLSLVRRQYLATADRDFAVGHLDNLVKEYWQYDNHFSQILRLYWQAPVWDATENTAATCSTSNGDDYAGHHRGYGCPSTLNLYQYSDARAIAVIATLAGNTTIANDYTSRASVLQSNLIK